MGRQHLDVLLFQKLRDRIRCGAQVEQAPLLHSLPDPCVIVAIPIENDPLMGLDGALDQLMQGGVEVLRALQFIRVELQRLGHRGVEHDVGTGDAVGGPQHTELKFIAGKGEGRGAVAVRGIPEKAREHIHPQLHLLLFHTGIGGIGLDGVQNGGQLIPQEDRDHGGRRFVGAQPVVVSGRCNRGPQQPLIVVHRLDHCRQEQQELGVFMGRLAGREQVHARVGGEGPVVVLAAAVDPGKGLFVEQAHHAMPGRYPLHDLHGQLVLVRGQIGGGVNGGKLMLGGRYLVVLRLGQDPQLP